MYTLRLHVSLLIIFCLGLISQCRTNPDEKVPQNPKDRDPKKADDAKASGANKGRKGNERQPSSSAGSGHLDLWGASLAVRDTASNTLPLQPQKFFSDYVLPQKPILLKGSSLHFPAIREWEKDDNLLQRAPSFTSIVGISDVSSESQEVPLRDFLQNYVKRNWYMHSPMPSIMQRDVLIPNFMLCKSLLQQLSQSLLWYSGRDLFMGIERRNVDTVKCLIDGTSEVTLIDPFEFSSQMPDNPEDIDVTKVDLQKFPGLKKVEFERSSMVAGDCLYIPAKWYQQTNTYGRTIAVDLTYHRDIQKGSEIDCGSHRQNQTVREQTFLDQPDGSLIRLDIFLNHFIGYTLKNDDLIYEEFEENVKKDKALLVNMTEWTEEYAEISREVFQYLDIDGDEMVSQKDFYSLTEEVIEKLRGELVDRVEAYKDIMDDQQEDKLLQSSEKGLDPFTQQFIGQYVDQLESVLVDSINEFVKTGTMPDVQAKMAEMDVKKLIGKKTDEAPKQKPAETEHYTSREDAKAKLKAKKEKQEAEKAKQEPEKEDDREYVVVNDSNEEEEILADDDDDTSQKKGDNPDTDTEKGRDQPNKQKTASRQQSSGSKKPEKGKAKKKDEL